MINRVIMSIVVISVLILPVCLGGCAAETQTDSELQILNHDMTTHEFGSGSSQSTALVKGKAKNASDSTIKLAIITVDFYDKNENLMDTLSATRQNLGPGEEWNFSIQSTGPDAWKSISYNIAAGTEQ